MNVPPWFVEMLARPLQITPEDPAPRPLGLVAEASPTAGGMVLRADHAAAEVSFLTDSIVEIRVAAGGDQALPSFARAEEMPIGPPASLTRGESERGWLLRSTAARVDIGRDPLRLRVSAASGETLLEDVGSLGACATRQGWRAHWVLAPGDRVYGLGAKTGPLDRRGRRTMVWARDMFVGERSDPLYSAVPFVLIARGSRWCGVLIDSAARTIFDLGATKPECLSAGPDVGPLGYVVFTGPTLGDVLRQYTALTGRAPLPPLWALGHHQSRYSYADEEEVRRIAAEFRRRDIPTDAIHLDIHYMRGFRVFTFDARRFPDPAGLARDLAADGFRLVAIVDPGVKVDRGYEPFLDGRAGGHFASRVDGSLFSMQVWPGDAAFPDFYRTEVRRWWGDWHRVYTDAGIAGIWADMNEPAGWGKGWYIGDGVVPYRGQDTRDLVHRLDDGRTVAHHAVRNAYGHGQCRATYEGLRRLRPAERPFVLTRSAFAGTQRYAAQWTGDVSSSWSALRQSLPMMMGMGLSGMSFAGSDIGGFLGDCTPELYARWVQIGALAPFCRSHTSLYTRRQEPWSFGLRVETIAREALKLRYRLLPYLYTCFFETAQTGMPVWRPLFAEFPHDARVAAVEDQVMVGPALLAAPVMERGATHRRVVLPEGAWFDWHTGAMLAGGRAVEVDAPRERLPLFVRGDSAIPTQRDVCHTGDRPDGPIIWRVFLTAGEGRDIVSPMRFAFASRGGDDEGEPSGGQAGIIGILYEDDGISFAHQEGDYRVTPMALGYGDEGVNLRYGPGCGSYLSARTEARIELQAPRFAVSKVDGSPVAAAGAISLRHDGSRQVIEIKRRDAASGPLGIAGERV